MGIIISVVAIGFLGIVGIIAYSMFSDAFADFQKEIEDRIKDQNDQVPPEVDDVGNFAEDTGTRVCNLKIEFVGSISGQSFSDDIKIWHGSQSAFGGLITEKHDSNVINYRWWCQDAGFNQATLLDMLNFVAQDKLNDLQLSLANLLRTTEDIELRFWLTGESKNTGNRLVGSKTPDGTVNLLKFSDKETIPEGIDFPIDYGVPVYLYKVTEDDYTISWWNEEYISNDRNVNHKFSYTLCKPANFPC